MKKHIFIFGNVQGVGFRRWLYIKAIENNIYGWVKNKASGEVETLLVGSKERVDYLIKLCKKGPPSSEVKKIKIDSYHNQYFKKSFEILKTS